MENVYIEIEALDKTIQFLGADNEKIIEIISSINNSINSLDDKVWQAPEKSKVTNELIPYLESRSKKIQTNLNTCRGNLIVARNNYANISKKPDINNVLEE